MESAEHVKISSVISPILVVALYGASNPISFLALSLYGVAAGVLIDLDHFIWARYNHGHWNHLLEAFEKPFTVIQDNKVVMEDALKNDQRYLSHLFIFALAGSMAYTISLEFMALTTGMIGVHLLCDLHESYRKGKLPF